MDRTIVHYTSDLARPACLGTNLFARSFALEPGAAVPCNGGSLVDRCPLDAYKGLELAQSVVVSLTSAIRSSVSRNEESLERGSMISER